MRCAGRIGVAFFCFWTLVGGVGLAHGAEADLDGRVAVVEVGQFGAKMADASGALELQDAQAASAGGEFAAIGSAHFDAGYSATPIWLAIPIRNIAAESVTYLVSTNVPYVPALMVHLVRADGSSDLLLDKTLTTPWRADQFSGQSVVSESFRLVPGEAATLFVRYQPYGIGVLPLSLETPLTLLDRTSEAKLTMAAFYGFALTSLALFLMFVVAMWHPGGLNFLALFSCGLVMMAQLDGLLNQWLWPNWPEWNKVASFPMLLALCAAGFLISAFMLRSGGRVRLARVSRWMAAGCFAPLLLVPFVEIVWLILIGFVFMATAMGAVSFAVINWSKLLPGKGQIALAISVSMFLAVATILIFVLSGSGSLSAQNLTLVKVLYVLITLIIMTAYATHVAALERDYAVSVERELALARNEARISADLLDSERRYTHARDLVARQRSRLANASHDLRQPIASLRLTLDSMAQRTDGGVDETITRAFDYLDDLVGAHLLEAREEEEALPEDVSDVEDIAAALITSTVFEMFTEEAAAKGIHLRHFESSATMRVPPIPVMRIVSNLVSNAIKYTEAGGVLVGSRRFRGQIAVEVCDTGPGMDGATLETLCARYEKGEASQGEGLGLAICYELAAQHGFELAVQSKLGQGTRFRLLVPDAKPLKL